MLSCLSGNYAIPHNGHWELVNKLQESKDVLAHFNSSTKLSSVLRDFLTKWYDAPNCCVQWQCTIHSLNLVSSLFFALFPLSLSHSLSSLHAQPSQRPSAIQCLSHPFFAQYRQGNSSISLPAHFPLPTHTSDKNELVSLEKVCALLAKQGSINKRGNSTPLAGGVGEPNTPSMSGSGGGGESARGLDSVLCNRVAEKLVQLFHVPFGQVRQLLVRAYQKTTIQGNDTSSA